MNTSAHSLRSCSALGAAILASVSLHAQSLLNIDFAANPASIKIGPAATGQGTNDFWNPYSHYQPKFTPAMKPVGDGLATNLNWADGTPSGISISVTNAPGVWGQTSGDAMFDTYMFAPNGSNIVVTLTGLESGRYNLFLYGHADADGELATTQDSRFTLRQGTNLLGPIERIETFGAGLAPARPGWPVAVLRDVALEAGAPVVIEAIPGRGGIAVLNGLQVQSRGTSPPRLAFPAVALAAPGITNLLLREVRYDGRLGKKDARFRVALEAESRSTNETAAALFEGELALLSPQLPDGWRIVNAGHRFLLVAGKPGSHRLEFDVVPRVQVVEPWRSLKLTGPAAAIATVSAVGSGTATEIQLLSGTQLERAAPDVATNSAPVPVSIQGALGVDRTLSLRWQDRAAEATREAVVAVDTRVRAHVAAAQVRYTSEFRLDVLQSRLGQIRLELPSDHSLTQVKGDAVRGWQIAASTHAQVVTVEFLRPIEGTTLLTVISEQAVATLPRAAILNPPRPVDVQRETGAIVVSSEDVLVRVEEAGTLRQANAGEGEVASFRFSSRPATLRLGLRRVEPLLSTEGRVAARVEESRLVLAHALDVTVARAGVYQFQFAVPAGLVVSDVRSEGLEDWRVSGGMLTVNYRARVLGPRRVEAQLEQAFTNAPAAIALEPLRLAGAERETSVIGAAAERGLTLRTASVAGAREIPIEDFPKVTGESLAFRSDAPAWRVSLGIERLAARVLGEVFNLLTVGEGVVGGSATIRFGILNQGVQTFRLRVPAHWRSVEFTGPNLRRTDRAGDVWTLSLQDKAWGAYTLVATYDYPIETTASSIDAAGLHLLDVEREEGTVAVTAARGLTLETPTLNPPLRPIDAAELAPADRALIVRPVLLAARYAGTNFSLSLSLARHAELPLLDAVADRAQFTTVLTESGERLTQAGFLVKNNERQFQRFRLPPGSTLWAVAVNGVPTKADRDGDSVLVPLPRTENRDEAFAIDLKYAQPEVRMGRLLPRSIELTAPTTDVAGTYAEWELYVPSSRRVAGFGGNMTVARGTTYGFRDGWERFVQVYRDLWHDHGVAILGVTGAVAFLVALVVHGMRRGAGGVVQVVVLFTILTLLAGMLLPALAKAKSRAQRISSVNNLKNLGLVLRTAGLADGATNYPPNLDALMASGELTARLLTDPRSGERYTYVGGGKSEDSPWAILAYSAAVAGARVVLMADGSVQQVNEAAFGELLAEEARQTAAAGGTVRMDPTLASRYGLRGGAAAPVAAAGVATATGNAAAPSIPPLVGTAPSSGPSPAAPLAVGLRSLKIDLPRSGTAYRFTRTLNLTRDPASVKVSLMSAKTFLATRSLAQSVAFVVGLLIAWAQWRRTAPNALGLAAGVALAGYAATSAFVTWRVLHLVLIVGAPAAVLVVVIVLAARFLRRLATEDPVPPTQESLGGSATAAAALALLIAFSGSPGLGAAVARAAEPAPALALQPADDRVSILSATYVGTAHERVAELDAVFEMTSTATNRFVPLFGPETAVRELTISEGTARLAREADCVGVFLPEPGRATIRAGLLVRLGGDIGRRTLEFAIPPVLAGQLRLDLDEADAQVEFPGALALRLEAPVGSERTRLDAVLGTTGRAVVSWSPRVRRGAGAASVATVQEAGLVNFGGAVVNTRAWLTWTAAQGELTQVRIAVPAGQRVLKLSGDALRSWAPNPTNRQELQVELLRPSAKVTLSIETEHPLDMPPATVTVALPSALDARRISGTIAVHNSEEVGVQIERTLGLERIDGSEFARAVGDDALQVQGAWRFSEPNFGLVVKTEVIRPRLEVVARHQFLVGADRIGIHASFDYTVSKAGVFSLSLSVPPEARVEAVTCPGLQMWSERTNATGRVLELNLKQRTLGALPVQVVLSRPLAALPPLLELRGLSPVGVEALAGFVSVAVEPGVGVKTTGLSGLVEIPATAIGSAGTGAEAVGPAAAPPRLAYKLLRGDTVVADAWTLALATERVAPWVQAEDVHVFQVAESLVRGRLHLRYTVENAPVKEFRIRVPSAWRNVEISGAGIRSRDQRPGTNGVEWIVEPQNRVLGEFQLGMTWEFDRIPTATNSLVLTGAEPLQVDRGSGFVVLTRQGQIQLAPQGEVVGLRRVDARELTDWARQEISGGTAVLNFNHVQSGWRVGLEVTRFDDAAVLSALVESVRLRSVVADDGQWMTQLDLAVRHNSRQHLAIRLPAGAEVWSAFVDGQPVRPSRRGDAILLPLERSAAAEAPVPVELTYVGGVVFPAGAGRVELVSPRLDAPLKDARWEVFLPPDHEYTQFGGTMTWESADLVPVVQDFTVGEYGRQEWTKASVLESQTLDNLRLARRELVAGNVDRANDQLAQARNRAFNNASAAEELKQIEDAVNRIQGSNLIQAQQSYLANALNSSRGAVATRNQSTAGPSQDDEARIAELQVRRLQRAQAVGVSRVTPLRVNLPTQGIRHSFTQILQTGVDKPLTVEFQSRNTRDTGWRRTAALSSIGFIGLWGLARAAIRRRRSF